VRFVRRDVSIVLLEQRDLVQPLEQALAREGVDSKLIGESLSADLL